MMLFAVLGARMCEKKATKTELALGYLVGFVVAFLLAAYLLGWCGRLTG